MLHIILRTFLHPFQNLRRSATFFGIFLGCFGFTLVNVTSSYALGSAGLWALLSYFLPALLLSGFIFWPLLYLGFSTIDSIVWRMLIITTQIGTLALFLSGSHQAFIQGITSAVLMAPFWTTFHIAMVQNTTNHNRGFEVSLAGFLGGSGSILGTLVYGVLTEHNLAYAAIILALLAMLVGTALLLFASRQQKNGSVRTFVNEARRIMAENPQIMQRLASLGLLDAPGFAMAAFMHMLNFSVTAISLVLTSRILSEFILTPIFGHLAHHHHQKGFRLGLLIVAVSWIFLLASPQSTLAFTIFLILTAMGRKVTDNSMSKALYETQSYASMMWNEFFLAVGRGAGMILLLPVLYLNPQWFIVLIPLVVTALAWVDYRYKPGNWLKKAA